MKKINILSILSFCFLLSACCDDLGNYDYRDINDIEVDSIRSMYSRDIDDSLCIYPIIQGSLYSDTSRFSYVWEIGSREVATTHNLEIVVNMQPGHKYSRYIVKDKKTGVKKYYEFAVNVSSATASDLLMVLSKYQGRAELSYLRLDKSGNWAINYYKERFGESLGSHPQQLTFCYIEKVKYELYPFANEFGRIMVLVDDKIHLIDKSTLYPDTITPYLSYEAYTINTSYPKPVIKDYKSQYMVEVPIMWRFSTYGWQQACHFMEISGGALYLASQTSKTVTPHYDYRKTSPYNGLLSSFGYWDDMSYAPSDRNPDIGYIPGDFIVYDKKVRRFASSNTLGAIKPITTIDAFTGYDNMLWGSATNMSDNTSIAILNNGNQCHMVLLQNTVDDKGKPTKGIIGEVAAGNAMNKNSKFYMMKYNDYLFFSTGDKLYRYNLLNITSSRAPSEADLVLKLSDYGYDGEAIITDFCVSRTEKTMLIGVSRYGSDFEGSGEAAKGDILHFDLDATTLQVTHREEKSHIGIAGVPVDIEIKYQTFWRDGKNEKGVLIDNI